MEAQNDLCFEGVYFFNFKVETMRLQKKNTVGFAL
jgi:hypothetical protein